MLELLPPLVGLDVYHPPAGGQGLLYRREQRAPVGGAGDDVGFGDFLRRVGKRLGEAPGQGPDGPGILLFQPPQELPGLLVPGGRDGAGVHHVDIGGVLGLHHLKAVP